MARSGILNWDFLGRSSGGSVTSRSVCFLAFISAFFPSIAESGQPAAPNWSVKLRNDAQAIHDIIERDHPGAIDPANPEFEADLEKGLRKSLQRSEQTSSQGGWWWALKSYTAGFDDAHLSVIVKPPIDLPQRWPGFLTRYSQGSHVVADTAGSEADLPPVGARLISCDGTAGDRLAAKRVGEFFGNWSLEAQRAKYGGWLFRDGSNPWLAQLKACRFSVDGHEKSYSLRWRPIGISEITARQRKSGQSAHNDFGVSVKPDGTVWVFIPSFDGSPSSDAFKSLTSLTERLAGISDELKSARAVVLDLRGNDGGSSEWATKIGTEIWGASWLAAHPVKVPDAIEWRVSEGNIRAVQKYVDEYRAAGVDEGQFRWATTALAGLQQARIAGQRFWRETLVAVRGDVKGVFRNPVSGPIYVLTDAACYSACLDAVDLWKSAGAVQIGQVTGADTVYIENKLEALPSGIAILNLSMKVYRGRMRGNNQPQQPDRVFTGDMSDEHTLTAWINQL